MKSRGPSAEDREQKGCRKESMEGSTRKSLNAPHHRKWREERRRQRADQRTRMTHGILVGQKPEKAHYSEAQRPRVRTAYEIYTCAPGDWLTLMRCKDYVTDVHEFYHFITFDATNRAFPVISASCTASHVPTRAKIREQREERKVQRDV
jgi:hypothetical protein